ncbi:hypothetical protein WKW80_34270 [Variovorax humicola]|uniref:Uncharacterized protein n=1 Tax=Variovorax humicola TaxID=1769758 RepID=A0ABU8WAR5_9BURK
MLTGIVAQLRSAAVAEALPTASTDDIRRFQAVVLECAAQLDLLHIALRTDNTRRRTIEASSAHAMLDAVQQLGELLPETKGARKRGSAGQETIDALQDVREHTRASKRGA